MATSEEQLIILNQTWKRLSVIAGVPNPTDFPLDVVGAGTVTSVSVVTANGISGSVATDTTTPAITLTLGAIQPTSVVISSGDGDLSAIVADASGTGIGGDFSGGGSGGAGVRGTATGGNGDGVIAAANGSGAGVRITNATSGASIAFANTTRTGKLTSAIAAASASTTVGAFTFAPINALDATDLILDIQTSAGAHLFSVNQTGKISVLTTDNSASPGATTIDRPSGKAAVASGASSVVVTNSTVTAASCILITPIDIDTLAPLFKAVAGAGSFTVTTYNTAGVETVVGANFRFQFLAIN